MDWVIDSNETESVREFRAGVVAYLRRHAAPDTDLDDVELVVGELVSNGARHAAGALWVSIYWSSAGPVLRVADVGPGFDLRVELPPPDSIGGRGLFIVSKLASRLEATRRRSGGAVVTVTLPITRETTVSFDPPRRRTNALPALDEAQPTGGFGKEAFLRALVVQLAQAVAEQQAPEAAERAVAQVGIDVGGQMEAEYRAARGIVGKLSTEQLGECYVRLKHAIDGEFSIVEVSERRIVLENTRCPFGEVVRSAPSLCRMTSSVFGGIAARNAEQAATVVLEERIAVGDAGCRVVVELDPDGPSEVDWSHRYRTPH